MRTKKRIANVHKSLYLSMEQCRKHVKERFNLLFNRKELPITFDQWLILNEVAENIGINQKTVAKNLSKEVASVSRILTKLVDMQLVIRRSNPENMRESNLFLTPEGTVLIERIEVFESQEFKSIFFNIYEQELNLVIDVLRRVE